MLREHYLHPNGQIPAYEWNFGDVNPPVHAWATCFLYRHGAGAARQGRRRLPGAAFQQAGAELHLVGQPQGSLRQERVRGRLPRPRQHRRVRPQRAAADRRLPRTGRRHGVDGALQSEHAGDRHRAGARTIRSTRTWPSSSSSTSAGSPRRSTGTGWDGMWDEEDGFFYDVLRLPDGSATRLKVRSMVGLLPLCATTVIEKAQRERVPKLRRARIQERLQPDARAAATIAPAWDRSIGVAERSLLALVTPERLRRVLTRMLDENEFLSPYGIRSLSQFHEDHPYVFNVGGQEYRVGYLPAESDTGMFGGNSNWRGPIWMPVNVLIIRALLQLLRLLRRRFPDRMSDRLREDDEPVRGRRGDLRPADARSSCATNTGAGRCTAAPRSSRPIRTGATTSCSTSTSTATTAPVSAPVTRPAGPGSSADADPALRARSTRKSCSRPAGWPRSRRAPPRRVHVSGSLDRSDVHAGELTCRAPAVPRSIRSTPGCG